MRKQMVAGNWKMNTDLDAGSKLASEIVNMVADEVRGNVGVILAPPFIHLTKVGGLIRSEARISLAAQNCSEHEQGAYTGEVSAAMLASAGVNFVILGHSERREYFKETNAQLARNVDVVMSHGLLPIFCCGESLTIRERGDYVDYVCEQLKESLFHLSKDDMRKIVIAYEPIWAIGTGKTASADQAQEMHHAIRAFIGAQYGNELADDLTILYGGSCKPSNAPELFACPDVDGGLIGGASLSSRDFVDIIK